MCNLSGRSSGVERNLAKVEVEGSNPFARSKNKVSSQKLDIDFNRVSIEFYVIRKCEIMFINKNIEAELKKNSDHVILKTLTKPDVMLTILKEHFQDVALVGYGKSIEIFKQVGDPSEVVKKFKLDDYSGSHAIGHTRMATESAITTDGSHPYSTGEDECLVHNGSLSNHNNLRRKLKKDGVNFDSENDTEVAAGYISNNLSNKKNLKETLKDSLRDLDGFYTFITGTKDGFAVLRDEIACKPAVIAETDDYVAIASEFQAMAHLPEVNNAKIFEPEPGVVYSWGN